MTSSGPETIRYGDDPNQLVELSVPDGDPRGVVVVVHGGFWKAAYDLSLGRPLAADLVARGWAALTIEYRRVGNGGGVPQTLDDVRAAIGTLDTSGLDLTRVVTLGHSAGGHLAAWAGHAVDAVTHVVSQAGVLDLVAADRDGLGSGAVVPFLGHPAGPGDADVDPRQHLPLDVPVWCVHGTEDDVVPVSQSRDYVAAATDAGAQAELVELAGDHFDVIDTGHEAWRLTLEILDGIG
ncbi:alpha/beta hydrolase family protein [Nocardioides halotolerans]|uniref:alpha/beta hydrolase family protein n=1 Tax=Nocardioides halotolerans TaxID=433660 RepID=UPI00042A894E|nr:alpha/beta hydrolase [Nocardioides halotolerans]